MNGGRSCRCTSAPRLGGASSCPPPPVRCVCSASYTHDRFLSYVPFASIAMTITMAAKVELFIYLACLAHRPVASPDHGGDVVSLVARHVATVFDGERSSRSGGNLGCAC